MACSVIRPGMGNDDGELRGNVDFSVATAHGRRRQDGGARKRELIRSGGQADPGSGRSISSLKARGCEDWSRTRRQVPAGLNREGKKVMQFLIDRKYIANVVDGKVQFYGRGSGRT